MVNRHSLVLLRNPNYTQNVLLPLQTEDKNKSCWCNLHITTDTKIRFNLRRYIGLKSIQLIGPALLAYAYLESASSEQSLPSLMVHELKDMQ